MHADEFRRDGVTLYEYIRPPVSHPEDQAATDRALDLLLRTESQDPLQNEDFGGSFPNLLRNPTDEHSILTGERERLQFLYGDIARSRVDARMRNTVPELLDGELREAGYQAIFRFAQRTYRLEEYTYETERNRFLWAAHDARNSIARLLRRQIPESDLQALGLGAYLDLPSDPVALLRQCSAPGTDEASYRKREAAKLCLVVAQIRWEQHRRDSSPERLSRDVMDFVHDLDRDYFGSDARDVLTFSAELDPYDCYRCSHIQVSTDASPLPASSLTHLHGRLEVRWLVAEGRRIPVLCEIRAKQDSWIKLIQNDERDSRMIPDGIAFRLTYLTEEDLTIGVRYLRQKIVKLPGSVHAVDSNLARAGVVDVRNAHSAEEFRARKFNFTMYDRTFEGMFMLLPDRLNVQFSRGPENHGLYKGRQMVGRVLSKIIPGVNWSDPALRRRMYAKQLEMIAYGGRELRLG